MTNTHKAQDEPLNQPSNSGNGRQHPHNGQELFRAHSEPAVGRPVEQPGPDLEINGQEEELSPQELAQIWARRAYELAEAPPAPMLGQTLDLLVFWLDGERYGLEVTNVREIYPLEQLTPVPRTPNFVTGVFSARGRILSVVDLRAFMGLSATELTDQTKIIVVGHTNPASEMGQMEIGLLADEVADVLTVFKEDIDPPLTTHTDTRTEYIHGVTTDLLVVLNLNTLLNDKRLIVYEEII